jgi:hypothetical protein
LNLANIAKPVIPSGMAVVLPPMLGSAPSAPQLCDAPPWGPLFPPGAAIGTA